MLAVQPRLLLALLLLALLGLNFSLNGCFNLHNQHKRHNRSVGRICEEPAYQQKKVLA